MNNVILSWVILFGFLALPACNQASGGNQDDYRYRTLVHGTITSADEYENDGIGGLRIVIVDRAVEPADTLYSAFTEETGHFSGEAMFRIKNEYPLILKQNGEQVATSTLVLADGDTVTITAEMPDFSNTVSYESFENAALRTYRRLENQFYRLASMINAGAVEDDEIEGHMHTWADLYWSIREDYPNTIGAQRASVRSLEVLEGWDDEKNLQRINSHPDDPVIQESAVYYGTVAKLRLEGLDATLDFLTQLDERMENEQSRRIIVMNKVELLYDSLRIDQARLTLDAYRYRFDGNEDSVWAADMQYDLDVLAPGLPMPGFELKTIQDEYIRNSDLEGSPYILEIVELSNRQYQQNHPHLMELYEAYATQGLKLFTVPIEPSPVTINAFYSERPRPWAVAGARAYEQAELLDLLNVNILPTRYLVDDRGIIVRKYYEFNLHQLEHDLQELFN